MPLQLVKEHHPARVLLHLMVVVPPAVVDQPPVPHQVHHNTPVPWTLKGGVDPLVVVVPVSLHHRDLILGVMTQHLLAPGNHQPVGGQLVVPRGVEQEVVPLLVHQPWSLHYKPFTQPRVKIFNTADEFNKPVKLTDQLVTI